MSLPARIPSRSGSAILALAAASFILFVLHPSATFAISTTCPHEGTAYVTDGSQLKAIDLATGAVTTLVTPLGDAHGVSVDENQTTAYFVESSIGQLTSVDLDTGSTQVIATGLTGATGMALDENDLNAYVALTPAGDLVKVELSTGTVTVWTSGLSGPTGVALDTDHNVWVVESLGGKLTKISGFDGSIIDDYWGLGGIGHDPTDVSINAARTKAYVSSGPDIIEIDLAGGAKTVFSTLGSVAGVALNDVDTMAYVVDESSMELVAVDLVSRSKVVVAGGLSTPWDVALSRKGCQPVCPDELALIFADQGGNLYARELESGVTNTIVAGGLGLPRGIDVNIPVSKAYVTVTAGYLVEVDFGTGTGTPIASGLGGPWGVVVDAAETTAYVVESSEGELSSVDLSTGVVTSIAIGFLQPRGLALDPTETVAYVTEYQTGTLMRIVLATGAKSTVTPALQQPGGLVVNASGTTAYVNEENLGSPRLSAVDLSTGAISVVTTNWSADDFAVSRDETIAYWGAGDALGKTILASGASMPLTGAVYSSPTPMALVSTPCQGATVAPSRANPGAGSQIATCILVDTTGSLESLGSYGASLSWDPLLLDYLASTGGSAPFDAPTINETNVTSGELSFADADPNGAGGNRSILCVEFDVIGANGSRPRLDLELTSLFGAGTLNNLLGTTAVTDVTLDLVGQCVVGDVNRDGRVNSGDALTILSDEIMLPIPPSFTEQIAAGCGDVNEDVATDSTDANIVLSYEVGLPINPLYPIDIPIQTSESCPYCPPGSLRMPSAKGGSVCALADEAARAPLAAGESPEPAKPPAPTPVPGAAVDALLVVQPGPIRPRDLFEVQVLVDLGGDGRSLGSYGAVLEWDRRAVELVGTAPSGSGSFPAPLVNLRGATDGVARFAQASPGGRTGGVELVRFRFRARRALPHPGDVFSLRFSSLAGPGPEFEDLLPLVSRPESR